MSGDSSDNPPEALHGKGVSSIIATESLSPEQRRLLDQYRSSISSPGAAVGAILGRAAWDLRPVVLDRGKLSVVRFSDPRLFYEQSDFSRLTAVFEWCAKGGGAAPIVWGTHDSQVWVARPFYSSTLAVPAPASERNATLALLQPLLAEVAALHRNGHVHGHLCPANIAVEAGQFFIVDHGLAMFSPTVRALIGDLPPEVRGSVAPGPGSDILGLGLIARAIFGRELPQNLETMLARMLEGDPSRRPAIEEVQQAFSPPRVVVHSHQIQAPGALQSGRLIKPQRGGEISPDLSRGAAQHRPEIRESPATTVHADEKAAGTDSKPPRSGFWLLTAVLAVIIGAAAIYGRDVLSYFYSNDPVLATEWNSGDAQRMQPLAERAVAGDSAARRVIVAAARQKTPPPHFRATLVRTAYDPHWEKDLSSADRQAVFRIALAPLVPRTFEGIAPLESLHPGIALAIAADLPLSTPAALLGAVPIDRLATLAAPAGNAFAKLITLRSEGKQLYLSRADARGLAHLISGDFSADAIEAFLGSDEPGAGELLILTPLFQSIPGLADESVTVLRERSRAIAARLPWFEAGTLGQWDKVTLEERLLMTVGLLPNRDLLFEQYADLLTFPLPGIRREARERLFRRIKNADLWPTFDVLASEENRLTRDQTIGAVAALQLEKQAAYSYVASWFQTHPDPGTVLAMLVTRPPSEKLDAFSVEAARYLKNEEWNPSIEQLRKLVANPEKLVRVIAYSRIKLSDPAQVKILKEMKDVEPDKRLKDEIQRRLADAQSLK